MAPLIPALVLAAGRSSRIGRPKATLPLEDGETFLSRIVRTFLDAGVDDLVVVVGHHVDEIVDSLEATGLSARIVVNRNYDRGQLSSIVAGLAIVDRPGVAAALITLVDVPFVSAATVRTVLECYRRTHAPVVRPTSGTRHGHPLLIDRRLFDELRSADPASGAKPVVRAHASAAGDVPIADEGAYIDIDTEDEYRKWVRIGDRSAGGGDSR
jgi:molybdenum cofactor cytidylyltransferase